MQRHFTEKNELVKKINFHISILVIGWGVTVIGFYPGFMSPDSFNQYSQALTGHYNDHHPVVMAVLWSLLNQIASGPLPMLLFQITIYWTAVTIIYLKFKGKKRASIIIWFSFSPFILSTLGVIWKDVQFAVGLLLIIATSIDRKRFKSNTLNSLILILEFLLIVYVANIRGNSWLVIPFVIFIWIRSYFKSVNKWKTVSASIILTLGMFSFGQYFTYQIIKATPTYIVNDYLVDNLVYFSILEGKSLIPDVDYLDIKNCAPATIAEMKLNLRMFCLNISGKYNTSSMKTEQLLSEFKDMVIKHPVPFAKYKLAAFSEFEGTFWHKNYYYWQTGGVDENSLGISQTDTVFTTILKKYADTTAALLPMAFSPLFWLWSSLIMMTLSWRCRRVDSQNLILLISSSAFLYNFQNILGAGGPDFRYFYWSAMATGLSFVLLKLKIPTNLRTVIFTSPISLKLFWITLTLIFVFQVQIFHHVNYENMLYG